MGGSSDTKFLQDLLLYAASAAMSCLVLFVGLRHLDPNREASKKALEHKKEIAKRLGRPLIQTNPYEVPLLSLLMLSFFIFSFFPYFLCIYFSTLLLLQLDRIGVNCKKISNSFGLGLKMYMCTRNYSRYLYTILKRDFSVFLMNLIYCDILILTSFFDEEIGINIELYPNK